MDEFLKATGFFEKDKEQLKKSSYKEMFGVIVKLVRGMREKVKELEDKGKRKKFGGFDF